MSQSKHTTKDTGKKEIKKSQILAGIASGLDQHAHQTLRGHGQTHHGSKSREKKPEESSDPVIRGPTRMAKMDQTIAPAAASRMPKMDKTMAPAASEMPKMDQTMKPPESSRMPKTDKTLKHGESSKTPKVDKTMKHGEGSKMGKIDKTVKVAENSRTARVDQTRAPTSDSRLERMDRSAAPSRLTTISYTTQRDQTLASRQTRIDQLTPDQQREQEQWAQMQLQISTACPAGLLWLRGNGGYQCAGGGHWVSNQSLASGIIVVEPSWQQLALQNALLVRAARINVLRYQNAMFGGYAHGHDDDGGFHHPDCPHGHDHDGHRRYGSGS